MEATGLSRRIVEHIRKMRVEFEAVTEKAMAERVIEINDELVEDESELDQDENEDGEISEESEGDSDHAEDSDEDSP